MIVARLMKSAGIGASFDPTRDGNFRRDEVRTAVSRSICI